MGTLIRVRCKNCYEEWPLQLGYGMMHGKIESVTPLLPDEIADQLPLEKLKNHEIPWSFAYEPAVCEHCKALISVPVIRLSKERIAQPTVCPDCGERPHLIEEDSIHRTPCPICGAETLDITDQGLWD